MSIDPFAALDQLVFHKNTQKPKAIKAIITPPKSSKPRKKPRPIRKKPKKTKIKHQEFNTNPVSSKQENTKKKANLHGSRGKSKSLRSTTQKGNKNNSYMKVDNSKYIEYKFGETKNPKRKSVVGSKKKRLLLRVNKGHTNRVEKDRTRELIQRKRIMKETREWYQEEDNAEIPVRRNNKEKEEEYSASKRRKR